MGLSLRVVHADFKSLPAGKVSTHHLRELRQVTELNDQGQQARRIEIASPAVYHPRTFMPSVPQGMLRLGQRTLPIESAKDSNGRHGGRYLHKAQIHAPGVGTTRIQYHAVLRNDTIVMEDRAEVIKIDCPIDSDEMIVTSAAPFRVQPGQALVFEQGWGCSERAGAELHRTSSGHAPFSHGKKQRKAASEKQTSSDASGQTVTVVSSTDLATGSDTHLAGGLPPLGH